MSLLDPLESYRTVYESEHASPEKSRACRICKQAMQFTHYDCARVDLGDFFTPTYRLYVVELVVLIAVLVIGGFVALTLGLGFIAGFLAMAISAPLLFRWKSRRFEQRAVWRCKPCNNYFTGPSLTLWKAP